MQRWTWSNSPIAKARNTALLDQGQMAEKLGVSVPVLVKSERHPETIRLGMLRDIYKIVPQEGKDILQHYAENFFNTSE